MNLADVFPVVPAPIPVGCLRIFRTQSGHYGVSRWTGSHWAYMPKSLDAMPRFLWPFTAHKKRKEWALTFYARGLILDEVHVEEKP
jgi:hypothetical protein